MTGHSFFRLVDANPLRTYVASTHFSNPAASPCSTKRADQAHRAAFRSGRRTGTDTSKSRPVHKKKPAAADELHMLKTGLEPVRIAPRDFKSPASAISPLQPILFYVMRREIILCCPIRSCFVPAYIAYAVKGSASSPAAALGKSSPVRSRYRVQRRDAAFCSTSSPQPRSDGGSNRRTRFAAITTGQFGTVR